MLEKNMLENIKVAIQKSLEEAIEEEFEEMKNNFIKKIEKRKNEIISSIALEITSRVSYINHGQEVEIKIDTGRFSGGS